MRTTSIDAYNDVSTDGTTAQHRRIITNALLQMESHRGTTMQISNHTQTNPHPEQRLSYMQVVRRMAGLAQDGEVVATLERGPSPGKKKAIVWELVIEAKSDRQ